MPRTLLVLMLVLLTMTGVAACGGLVTSNPPPPMEKIAIAVAAWPPSAAFYVANDKGYFREQRLDATLQPYAAGALALDGMLAGKADLAGAADTPIARAAMDGKPLTVIATLSENDRAYTIVARRDRGVSVSATLKGKRIGVVAGTGAEYFLHIYLTTLYVGPQDVHIVYLPTDQIVDALLTGRVDAVSTWSPYTLELRDELGSNAAVFQDPNLYTMTWNITATRDFVKSNPVRIQKLLRALLSANRFIQEQPAQARTITARYVGTDSVLYERDWQSYRFVLLLDQSLILSLEDQARWMAPRERAGQGGLPNFLDFVDAGGLDTVRPEAVRIAGR